MQITHDLTKKNLFFNSATYTKAAGIVHISDAHLGMYFLEDEDERLFNARMTEIRRQLQKWRINGDHVHKRRTFQQRLVAWENCRYKRDQHFGGINGFNKRFAEIIQYAEHANLLVHLNGDIFELLKKNTQGRQVTMESEFLRTYLQEYNSRTGYPVLYTFGNHDEANLHRKTTIPIVQFLASDVMLLMPKIWYDERAGALVTHGDFPGYRKHCVKKTKKLLQNINFLQAPIQNQVAMLLAEIDTDEPRGPESFVDSVISENIASLLSKIGWRKGLERHFLKYIAAIRRNRQKNKLIPESLIAEFVWMDLLATISPKIQAIVMGHTHFQVLERITLNSLARSYVEINSGTIMGSEAFPPSVVIIRYDNNTCELLEWGWQQVGGVYPIQETSKKPLTTNNKKWRIMQTLSLDS